MVSCLPRQYNNMDINMDMDMDMDRSFSNAAEW